MQVTLIHNSATRKSLEIIFPAPLVEKAFEAAITEITPKVKLPGFRPGKTPKGVLVSKFEREIVREVSEKLIENHFWDAITPIGLHPISRPAIERAEIREGVEGKVKVQFDVAPEVRLPDYKGVVLVKKKRLVDDEIINDELERMRQEAARLVPVESGAEHGHIVILDIRVKPHGMKTKSYMDQEIELDEGKPFDAEIMGMKIDEIKKFTLNHPEDDPDPAIAGKPVQYEVLVSVIESEVLPELDDEFAKDSGDFENLQALKDHIRKDLEESAERDAMARLQSDLLDKLLDASTFELPSSMVNLQLDDYCREFSEALSSQGISQRRINWGAYRRRRLVDAERAVRSGYLLQALGNAEDIQVSSEEIDQAIRDWIEETGSTHSFEAVKADFEKHGAITEFRGRVRTEKIFNMLLEAATITEEILDKAAYANLLEVERRREEGIAQARFDAGGLEGGDFEEQGGGDPEAIVPAEEAVASAEQTDASEQADETETPSVAQSEPAEDAPAVKRGRSKKSAAPADEEAPVEEKPPAEAAPAKRGRPKKADVAAEETAAAPEGEAKPKRARKKAETES